MATRRGAGVAVAAFCLGLGGLALMGGRVRPALAAGARICVEAESGKLTAPVTTYKDARECSGGAAIEVPEGVDHDPKTGEALPNPTGDSTLTIKVATEGIYQLWARCWWSDGCGNSFAVSVDDGDRVTVSSGNYKRWHWVRGPKMRLAAGTRKLRIHNTEDGARMDQIFLTTDYGRVPVGKEKATQ